MQLASSHGSAIPQVTGIVAGHVEEDRLLG
jgi:hypothetical protein